MIIRKYGIELHRLEQTDIELVRKKRNQDTIRQKMFDQHIITPAEQEAWYRSIDNRFNFYFLILVHNQKIGLIHGKNVEFDNHMDEGGIFIWDDRFIDSGTPAKASILFMEASFILLQARYIYVRVRKDNLKAINYNFSLGYTPFPDKGEEYMILTREIFDKNIERLRYLASNGKDLNPLGVSHIEIPNINHKHYLYSGLPERVLATLRPKFFNQTSHDV